jgi:hypothetical protein
MTDDQMTDAQFASVKRTLSEALVALPEGSARRYVNTVSEMVLSNASMSWRKFLRYMTGLDVEAPEIAEKIRGALDIKTEVVSRSVPLPPAHRCAEPGGPFGPT